ncbi:MAG TPA: molybdate ABC transporter substrate-binding protein [Acidimicrobiia bacterium]|nr:molybdate ABC transporter substrate-binding protein [Acidimicrobiia bacterium]
MNIRRKPIVVIAIAFAVLAAGCGSSKSNGGSSSPTSNGSPSSTPALSGTLTVLAASSLTNSFTDLGSQFEAAHPGTKVNLSFGASSDLVTQITQGAPADVFASADQSNMEKVVGAHDNASAPTDFAKNRLEIAVEPGNPKHITTLQDLTKPGVVVVLCDSTVPCGKFADQILTNAKVTLTPKSRELNVKATLSKVELGEADAAIVYVTDVKGSEKVAGVPIPDAVNVLTTLPIVTLKDSSHAALADAWVKFVVANESELASKYGFLPL